MTFLDNGPIGDLRIVISLMFNKYHDTVLELALGQCPVHVLCP